MDMRGGVAPASAAAVILALLVGSMGACGDPVTGPHAWRVDGELSSRSGVTRGNVGYTANQLRGALLNAKGEPIAGSSFSEQCTVAASGYKTTVDCVVMVNTGTKVYIARRTPSYSPTFGGTFRTFDDTGTITVSAISSNWQGHVEPVRVTVHKATA